MKAKPDIAELVRQYEAGASILDLAIALRSNAVYVRAWLIEGGATIRLRGARKGSHPYNSQKYCA